MKAKMQVRKLRTWLKENKSYVAFSIIVGVLGFLATLASVTEGGRQLLFFFIIVPFAVAVATGLRYERSRCLWGPLIVYSALSSAIFAAGAFYGVKFFGYGTLPAIPFAVVMLPLSAAVVAAILFAPSWVFFELVGKRSAGAKEWLVKNRAYLLFSLVTAAASITAGAAVFILTRDAWHPILVVFATVFAATLITSVVTAAQYPRVKKLLGPVVMAAFALAAAFGWMSFRNGQSLFGPVMRETKMRLLLIEIPLLFAAAVLLGFVLSALPYFAAKAILKKAGRNPEQ